MGAAGRGGAGLVEVSGVGAVDGLGRAGVGLTAGVVTAGAVELPEAPPAWETPPWAFTSRWFPSSS